MLLKSKNNLCFNTCMEDLLNISFVDLVEEDPDYVNTMEDLQKSLIEMQKHLDVLLPLRDHYDKMELPQRIEFDICFSYIMNGYYWVYLRLIGVDPTQTNIKDELQRTKEAMMKWKSMKDKSKRPTVDLQAAKRFIKSGLYDRCKRAGQNNMMDKPLNKKIKFDDSD